MTSDLPSENSSHDRHPACQDVAELLEDCDIERGRRGGPGGQHRNKVETAITVTHRPSGVTASASERRSQEVNRKVAVQRLRTALAIETRNVSSTHVEPSELWESRCRNQKIQCSEKHHDFPAMLAEALDAVFAKDADVRIAAAALGCSTSQLVRFLAKEPRALEVVNVARQKNGLRRLKP